ncbi:protein downstream neighbor of son homolog [Anabrus simplex]|uniref:protein downstream neighbor of son homolog n=1 Tax=Anabrus simplex TaxID=316456 RepID=UPI0034DCC510
MAQQVANDMSSPSKWKRPDEVMRMHLLKKKKRALQARMCGAESSSPTIGDFNSALCGRSVAEKRKNPFRCQLSKRLKEDEKTGVISSELDSSCDNTLFQLLTANTFPQRNSGNLQTSFTSILSKLQEENVSIQDQTHPIGKKYIPVDWTLKTKIRFMSLKPFAWNLKLKTCEEASGITGYVRCLNSCLSPEKRTSCSLDTSPNARFHQCCLVWQYPSFPWLTLFPRTAGRISSTASSLLASDPQVKECLHREWGENFRSLFQLVRALQCPYFYVCANNFTCLFRAAGIGGLTDIHALLTPTTRGFRQLLKDEDVVFSMPLKKSRNLSKRLSSESNSDTGYDTLDSINDDQSVSNTWPSAEKDSKDQTGDDGDDDDDENEDEWLQSMGIAEDEIRKLNTQQAKVTYNKEREVDKSPESLIYVEGIEAQALFNFLLNCKSTVASTGPLAGVPPTLLAPVAFRGATLRSLTVRQSIVKVESESFHSIEVRGPILPHTIHNLCGLMRQSQDEFSATFAHVESTRSFSIAVNLAESIAEMNGSQDSEASPTKQGVTKPGAHTPTKTPAWNVLSKENLSDCGLHSSLIETFCCPDMSRTQVVDSLKYNSDGTYTWS